MLFGYHACRHFEVTELVPKQFFELHGAERSIRAIDQRVLITLDQLREYFGPCTINDYQWGGVFNESGLRTPDCEHYSPTSQHTFGRAMDCKFKHFTAENVRDIVIRSKVLFPYITFIEDKVNWFHFDVRNEQRIQLWDPDTNEITMV